MCEPSRTPNPRGVYCSAYSRRAGRGGVGFTQSDPSRLWVDVLFLGFRGGADSCPLSWVLFPLALGIPRVPSHQSHVPQIVNVEAVGLFVARIHSAAEGRVSPEVALGTTQVTDEGCFLVCGEKKAEMVREGVVRGRAWILGCPQSPFLQLLLLSSWSQRECKAALSARLPAGDRCACLPRLELNRDVAVGAGQVRMRTSGTKKNLSP